MKVLLVCSPGGHLQQMLALEPAWRGMERAWMTLPGPDVDYLLKDEETTLGHGPTNRSAVNLLRNLALAWRLLRRRRPDVILSTGAGLAVPFFAVGKLLGIRLVYVESVTRTESISLSGRLVYPLADRFFAQWPEAAGRLRRAEYAGERAVIFVTVGTHHQPFERLLEALGSLDGEDLVVQYGPGPAPAGVARAEPYMPFDSMLERFREADKVITHAGVGSILCATREGHTPLVVPRRRDLGEHVDDHQVELARALAARHSVIAVPDVGRLAELIAAVPPRRDGGDALDTSLASSVGAALRSGDVQASEA